MLVTGLRSRFFAAILAVLVVVTVATIILHSLFLRRERLALIDQQVRETAAALVDSELGDLRKIDFAKADAIISDELGENRIGKFFIIRNQAGEIIFESTGARVLPIFDIPQKAQWFTLMGKGQFIRVLNLQLPRVPDRTLQVGLVISEDLLNPSYFSVTSLAFFSVVLSLGFIVSWFLTSTLLSPIRKLEAFLSGVSLKALNSAELPPIPHALKIHSHKDAKDEFNRLISGLDSLIEKVNRSYRLSRLWAYQMAHEIKTPLAILKVEVEKNLQSKDLSEGIGVALLHEVQCVSDTVTSFLSWAELENSNQQKRLFANKMGRIALDVQERLGRSFTDRIKCEVTEDFHVLASPYHVEQLVLNLLVNALTYSHEGQTVEIKVKKPSIIISDGGPGIPQRVLERLGEPFNRGGNAANFVRRGHGLGLAWVSSIGRLYDWKVEFNSTSEGTKVKITFPLDEDSISAVTSFEHAAYNRTMH